MANETTNNIPKDFIKNILESKTVNKRIDVIKEFIFDNIETSTLEELDELDNSVTDDKIILIAIDLLYNAVSLADYPYDNKDEVNKKFNSWICDADKTSKYLEMKLLNWFDLC